MAQWTRMLKRKVYPTWVLSKRIGGCKAYVFFVENSEPYYHFQIVCDDDIQYASLAHEYKYPTFEEACEFAELWLKDHKLETNNH